MPVITETVKEMRGYKLHLVKTDKYKTNTIVWRMKTPLTKEDVTLRALLPHVLQSSSEKYPTTTQLRSYLDDLYGTTLYVDLAKKGEYQIMSFVMEVANEKFLTDSTPLLQKAMEFLAEILLKPNKENQAFHVSTVEKEKKTLKQRIQSVFDDKMRYSNLRLVEEMFKEEPYSLHVNGQLDAVDGITAESLYQYYQKTLKEDEMDLYIIGDVEEAEVEGMVNNLFQFEERTPKEISDYARKNIETVNEVKEEQDVKQGKLNIGYRTNIVYGDPDYFALQVFNGIFGGFSHSKLFINVREKASLAYYAASRMESHKGIMMVMSGIDMNNYNQAVSIIHEQMEEMRKGNFTDDELAQTKAVIENQLLETIDTSRGIVEVLYHNVVSKVEIGLDQWIEEMNKVTKEEIIAVAQKIELDTIYFLTGLGAGKNEKNNI
ncbi:EF-P 5-aminopentanol modification-associated protein YfmF [Neobacillus sp. D3-1R]|uniref:EF-P 5-aminopentanol modification-associated protein YfmF n=1 Tax=Neobacillus sp. D3-1R TaxID=3445778 RepID=UPI003FA0B7F8